MTLDIKIQGSFWPMLLWQSLVQPPQAGGGTGTWSPLHISWSSTCKPTSWPPRALQRCHRGQALTELPQVKSCTSPSPHFPNRTGWVDGLERNSFVDSLPPSFSTQNAALPCPTKTSSVTEPASTSVSGSILPPPCFGWPQTHHYPHSHPSQQAAPSCSSQPTHLLVAMTLVCPPITLSSSSCCSCFWTCFLALFLSPSPPCAPVFCSS